MKFYPFGSRSNRGRKGASKNNLSRRSQLLPEALESRQMMAVLAGSTQNTLVMPLPAPTPVVSSVQVVTQPQPTATVFGAAAAPVQSAPVQSGAQLLMEQAEKENFHLPELEKEFGRISGPNGQEEATEIARRIKRIWEQTPETPALLRWIRSLNGDQRARGYFCWEWTRAYYEAFKTVDPKHFDVGVGLTNKINNGPLEGFWGGGVHYYIVIISKETGLRLFIDDGFAYSDGTTVHRIPPIPDGYLPKGPTECNTETFGGLIPPWPTDDWPGKPPVRLPDLPEIPRGPKF